MEHGPFLLPFRRPLPPRIPVVVPRLAWWYRERIPVIPTKRFRELNDLSDVVTRVSEEAKKSFMNKKLLAANRYRPFQIEICQRFQLDK